MINILSHKGNANQKDIEIPLIAPGNNKCWLLVGMEFNEVLWKSLWSLLKKRKMQLSQDR
jgi:hypothetical protein